MAKKLRFVPSYYGFRIYAISTILFMFLVFPITGILLFKYAPDLQKYRTGDYHFEEIPDDIKYLDPSRGGSLHNFAVKRSEIGEANYEKLKRLLPSINNW